jgi:hypothetical protein
MTPQVTEKTGEKHRVNPIANIPPERRHRTGRKPGSTNQKTVILKDALMMAGEIAGNEITKDSGLVGYLVHLALNKPELYVSMLGKIIPLQVSGTASDGALEIRWLPPQEPPKVIEHDDVE